MQVFAPELTSLLMRAFRPIDGFSNRVNLARDGRGRRAYVRWLEARAANYQGKIDEAAMKAIRRGWYLGKEKFRDRLLKLLDPFAEKAPGGRSHSGPEFRDHGEKQAARIVRAGLKELGLSSGKVALSALPKSDERKVLVACLLRERTCVSNAWIATRLSMGHPGSVSRMVSACRKNKKRVDECNELAEALSFDARSFQ
jgi:hypothetical protein